MGVGEGWGLPVRATPVTDLCPQADPVLPRPGAADATAESAEVAGGAVQSQVLSRSGPPIKGLPQDRAPSHIPYPTLPPEPCL